MEAVRRWAGRVVAMALAVIAVLATCSAFVDAVEWLIKTFGAIPAGMAATFVAGWILATATGELRGRRALAKTPPVEQDGP